MDKLTIYEQTRAVPKEAQKPITGGRLKGMTDINPMWRIKKLTELFGPAGIGWYYKIIEKRIEEGSEGQKAAFVDIELYIKAEGEWSAPIVGTGGAAFVTNEKNGPYTSDEAYKMALTDAISISCKALGFGADIYWQADRTKFNGPQQTSQKKNTTPAANKPPAAPPQQQEIADRCTACSAEINQAVKAYSEKHYGHALCRECQKNATK